MLSSGSLMAFSVGYFLALLFGFITGGMVAGRFGKPAGD